MILILKIKLLDCASFVNCLFSSTAVDSRPQFSSDSFEVHDNRSDVRCIEG